MAKKTKAPSLYRLEKRVVIVDIFVDETIQPSSGLNPSKVEEYCENYQSSVAMPAIIIHEIADKRWLCDGFTRLAGAKMAGEKFINAVVRENSTVGALTVEAIRANSKHGQPLSAVEKRTALIKLVSMYRDSGMPWTVKEMGEIAGYSGSSARRIIEKEFGSGIKEIQKSDPAMEKAVAMLEQASIEKSLVDPDAPETNDQRLQRIHSERLAQIEQVRKDAKSMHQHLRKVAEYLHKISVSPGGEVVGEQHVRFNAAKDELWVAYNYTAVKVCPVCFGQGMVCCNNRGWIMTPKGSDQYRTEHNAQERTYE